jgi:hypothetical protein
LQLSAAVKGAVLQMTLLYGLESALALVGGMSTLAGWRRIDFQLHHLPYALVVTPSAARAFCVFCVQLPIALW